MSSNPVLVFLQRLHRQVVEQSDDLQPALQRMMDASVVGSPADLDFKAMARAVRSRDRQQLWSRVQLNCLHSAVNVHDHVRALGVLLAAPTVGVPVYAHATVARTAIESAVNVAHVLDSTASFDLRFARGVAFLIDDSRAALQAAKRVPGNVYMETPGPEAQRRHGDLLALIGRARVEITPNRVGRPKGVRTSPGNPEVPIDLKMADLVYKVFPSMPAIYNLTSGVTHGLPSRLADNASVESAQAEWDANPVDIAGSVLAAMNAAHTVLASVGWHRGTPDDPAVAAAHTRVAAVDAAIARFGRVNLTLPKPKVLRAAMPAD